MRTIKTTTDATVTVENGTFENHAGVTVPNTSITIALPNGTNVRIAIITSDICGTVQTFGNIFIHTADHSLADGIDPVVGFVSF